MARLFAKVTGFVLLALGIIGFMSGDYVLSINSSTFEDSLHVILGLIGLYAGFAKSERPSLLNARVLGPVYILVVIVGLIIPNIFGLVVPPLRVIDNIIHLLLGVLSIGAGYFAANRSENQM